MNNRVKNFENEHIAKVLVNNPDGTISLLAGFNSGGYEVFQYFITADGGCLACSTVIAEIDEVDFNDAWDRQWFIVGVEVNYETNDLYDDHTGKLIPTAYGE